MRYTPNPVPDPVLRAELERIAYAMAQPQVGIVSYEPQTELPARPRAGMVAYFDAGVIGSGSAEGLYIFKSDGAWHPTP